MVRILFERRQGVYLPEISAYRSYLRTKYSDMESYDSSEPGDWRFEDFDYVWRFMGLDLLPPKNGPAVIHEYGSLSIGRFPQIKDRIKRVINALPFCRVFLNSDVARRLSFQDNIPAFMRDMGIADRFFEGRGTAEYDFVYAGSLYRSASIIPFLKRFIESLPAARFIIVGAIEPDDAMQLTMRGNVTVTGAVRYDDVPDLLKKARYGLNFTPDEYPFNLQTATKILEYCAAGLPVVSNRYAWIEGFARERGASFFWLPGDVSALTLKDFEEYGFVVPDVEDLRWDGIIEKSGVFDFLRA